MSLIDPNGVPVNDLGGSVIIPDDSQPSPPPPRRPKWLLALLALPLLAAGAYYGLSNRNGAEAEDTSAPAPRAASARASSAPASTSISGTPASTGASGSLASARPSAALRSAAGAPASTSRVAASGASTMRGASGLMAMRRTLESNGWTVHWLAGQHEARAWKAVSADRKKWSEVRVTLAPNGSARAMLMQKGPRGKVLQRQSLLASPAPRLQKGVLMAPSPLLGRATQKR